MTAYSEARRADFASDAPKISAFRGNPRIFVDDQLFDSDADSSAGVHQKPTTGCVARTAPIDRVEMSRKKAAAIIDVHGRRIIDADIKCDQIEELVEIDAVFSHERAPRVRDRRQVGGRCAAKMPDAVGSGGRESYR